MSTEQRNISGMIPKAEAAQFYKWVAERDFKTKVVVRSMAALVQMIPDDLLLMLMAAKFDETREFIRSLPPVPPVEELRAAVARRAAELNNVLCDGLNNDVLPAHESQPAARHQKDAEGAG
jgi:hypothetical protein